MLIYAITFIMSAMFIHYGYKAECPGRYRDSRIFNIAALFVPALLAGVRNTNIGTDVRMYAEPLFTLARNNSIREFYLGSYVYRYVTSNVADFEIGYSLLVFICSKIFSTVNGLLFVTQLLILIFVFKGFRAFNKNGDNSYAMLVFYLLFYNETLNMMRQGLALAIVFYGFRNIIDKNYKRYILICILAMLIHYSAFIGLFVLIFYIFFNWKGKKWKSSLMITSLLVILLFWNNISQILIGIGLIPAKYVYYVSGNVNMMYVGNATLVKIPVLLLGLLLMKNGKRVNKDYSFLTLLAVFDILFAQFRNIQVYAYRIGLYFTYVKMYYYVLIMQACTIKNNKMIIRIGVVLFLFVYWYYNYVYLRNNDTIPYKFFWD